MQHVNQGKNRDASVLIKYDLFIVRALKKASVLLETRQRILTNAYIFSSLFLEHGKIHFVHTARPSAPGQRHEQ
jgi:hypothetical protein